MTHLLVKTQIYFECIHSFFVAEFIGHCSDQTVSRVDNVIARVV